MFDFLLRKGSHTHWLFRIFSKTADDELLTVAIAKTGGQSVLYGHADAKNVVFHLAPLPKTRLVHTGSHG
jgi:hypothetical protein